MKMATLLISTACALTNVTALAEGRYSYSTDGSEVTDSQTELIWRRCAEGMSWSGATCTGSATGYTHEEALARAKTQSGWRLPNVKEIASITDKSRYNPAIDTDAFPATPPAYFWTATPGAVSGSSAWYISLTVGSIFLSSRNNAYRIRLVR